jgi:hypothetical protein
LTGSRDFTGSFLAIQIGFGLCTDSFIIEIDFCGFINFTQNSLTNYSPLGKACVLASLDELLPYPSIGFRPLA